MGFYHNAAWNKCRKSYLQKVDGLCERCANRGRIAAADIVHHKIYLTDDNISNSNISLKHGNLEALCQECHNKEHATRRPSAARYEFRADGSLSPPPSGKIISHPTNRTT